MVRLFNRTVRDKQKSQMTKELVFMGHKFTENPQLNNKVLAKSQALQGIPCPIYDLHVDFPRETVFPSKYSVLSYIIVLAIGIILRGCI